MVWFRVQRFKVIGSALKEELLSLNPGRETQNL
jgi:hypothetical protein